MPVTISSVKFSFIRFENADYILPAYGKFDVAFQFAVTGFLALDQRLRLGVTNLLGDAVPAFPAPVYAQILAYKMKIPSAIPSYPGLFYLYSITISGTVKNYGRHLSYAEFRDILLSDFGYSVAADDTFIASDIDEIRIKHAPGFALAGGIENTLQTFWGAGHFAAPDSLISPHFKPGDCFSYTVSNEAGVILGTSNRFRVLISDKYTSNLEYSNNENAFEFFYDGIATNKVRLPFFCNRPTWPSKKSVYQFSNGRRKLLSASLDEQYELQTDFFSKEMHRYFAVVMMHDNVTIDCSHMIETPAQVIDKGDYQPSWNDDATVIKAQGKTVVTVASFGYSNSNCEKRETECRAPVLSIGSITGTSAQLLFQPSRFATEIIINYRKLGASSWTGLTIPLQENITIEGLFAGTDYEVKVAAKCGSTYGLFGSVKSFVTSGQRTCTAPGELFFVDLTGNEFQLRTYLTNPVPDGVELRVTRPDGFVVTQLFPSANFNTALNPFTIYYTEASLQAGTYRFKARSKCSNTEYSLYTNEVVSESQITVSQSSMSYEFSVYNNASGTISISKNGNVVVRETQSVSSFQDVSDGDWIEVIINAQYGAQASLRVVASDAAGPAELYSGSNDAFQVFSWRVNGSKNYFITGSIF